MAGAGDAQLVEQIRVDPRAGWAAAWEAYGHPLHSYCLRMLDDPAEADDAVADVFVVAAQRIDQLRRPDAFRAWLYAIARRRVQRRWKDRRRTAPVDPHGDVMTGHATADSDPGGHADAAELLAAASSGLNARDRDLLALTLGADLDTTEVARITGEATNAVSVRVTRLKDTIGRAAGALLVARHHRRDCEVLDQLLGAWDGTFDTVWRKRIARHVEACDDCSERRRAATAVFAAPLLLVPPSMALRQRIMAPIEATNAGVVADFDIDAAATADELGPWDDDGFPTGYGTPKALPVVLTLAATVVIVALVVGIQLLGSERQDGLVTAAASTPTSVSTTTSSTAPDAGVPPETVPGEDPPPESTAGPGEVTDTTAPPAAPPATDAPDVGGPTTTTSTTVPAEPRVRMALAPAAVRAGPTATTTATVTVSADAGGASTVIAWDGPDAGSVVVTGTGTHSRTIGPFTGAPGRGGVRVTATTTDALGRTHSTTAALTVSAVPG